jgi:hypothetical protein
MPALPTVVIKQLNKDDLERRGVFSWPVWEKEVSDFDYSYDDSDEQCYFLEGEVEIETNGKKFDIKPGDFVIFQKGLSCIWHVKKPVRKHYNFG